MPQLDNIKGTPLAPYLPMNEEDPGGVDLMPLQEFIDCVKCGAFIDYDGSGYYANKLEYFRDLPARPSEIFKGIVDSKFEYVAWFNK